MARDGRVHFNLYPWDGGEVAGEDKFTACVTRETQPTTIFFERVAHFFQGEQRVNGWHIISLFYQTERKTHEHTKSANQEARTAIAQA